jgi:large subunit ribosomal protein L4
MALTSKLEDNDVIVIDRFGLERKKTKDFVGILEALGIDNALIVTDEKNDNLAFSSRNVPSVKVLRTEGLNVYDILKHRRLVLLEPSIKQIEGRLLG